MRKDGWIMMVIDVNEHVFMMLISALENNDIKVVAEPEQQGRHAYGSRKYPGRTFYVDENQKILALEMVKIFIEDFEIDPSKFIIVGE